MSFKLEEIFDRTDLNKRIRIENIKVEKYSVDIYLSNVASSRNSEIAEVEKMFGLKGIEACQVENGLYFCLSIPRVEVPDYAYNTSELLAALSESYGKEWILGISDFGPQKFDISSFTHGYVTGASGYGKSSYFRFLLMQTLSFHPDIINYIVDPKQVDFELYDDHPNVMKRASTYTEWMNLFFALMIEVEIRKFYFTNAFEKAPTNLEEYTDFKKKHERMDLPDFKRSFIWIDEAHIVFSGSHMDLSAPNVLAHIIRQARAFGIHFMFSSQKWSDITATVRSQIPCTFYFYTPLSEGGLMDNPERDKVSAIRGRLGARYGDRIIRNLQAPFMKDEESVAASYILSREEMELGPEFKDGFYRFGIDESAFEKLELINDLLKGEGIESFLSREVVEKEEVSRGWGGSAPKVDVSYLKELYKIDKSLNDIKKSIETKSSNIEAKNSDAVKMVNIIKPDQSKNKVIISDLIKQYQKAYKDKEYGEDLSWCMKDLSRNNMINLCYKRMLKHQKTLNILEGSESINMEALALSDKNERLAKKYIEEIQKIEHSDESGPLLVLYGESGMGKRTLLEAISKKLSMPLRESNKSDLLTEIERTPLSRELALNEKTTSKDEIIEGKELINPLDELVIFTDLEVALTFVKRPKGNIHPILFIDLSPEEALIEKMMINSSIKEKIRYLSQYNIFIHMQLSDYMEGSVLNKLIKALLDKYHYIFDEDDKGLGYGEIFAKHQVDLVPHKIDSIVERAFYRAKNLKKPFDKTILDEILNDFAVVQSMGAHNAVNVVSPKRGLDELIISNENRRELKNAIIFSKSIQDQKFEFIQKIRKSDRLVMLLCGPPGTGKTMSAEVIAKELGKELWVCSIARMQSAYVGQSEKIIESVFHSAQVAGAVLLIDECDAFLKSREQLEQNHEQKLVNHLLMLVENFRGVLVLTTNYAENLDSAISRRIDLKLFMDLPGDKEKVKILELLLLPDAPLADDINLDVVTQGLKLSGGLIKNAVERAYMLMIGEDKTAITQDMLRSSLEAVSKENELVSLQMGKISL